MAGLLSVGGAATGIGHFSKVQSTEGNQDVKLERIINKFKAGKKLSSGELSYLAKKNPAIYQKVLRIMQRREQLEERLEAAATKEEAQQIMALEMQSIENFCSNSDDDFEKTALVNQMMDAYGELTKSDAYREKTDTNAELAKQKMESFLTEDLSSKDNGMWNGMSGKEDSTDGVESIAYEENATDTDAATDTSNVVTYTAKGTKESVTGKSSKKGTLLDVAL